MPNRRTIFSSVKAATVAIVVITEKRDGTCPFNIVGSGFCIDPIGIVVTCEHVLSAFMTKPLKEQIASFEKVNSEKGIIEGRLTPRSIPHVIFYKAEIERQQLIVFPTPGTIFVAKTDFDLALVRVVPHAGFPTGFPFLEIEDYQNVCDGDEIATCGFPLGNYLHEQLGTATSSFTKGIISSIIPVPNVPQKYLKGFQLNLTAGPGNSGGPVFSLTTGKVFGVLQGGPVDRSGKVISNLTKAEPVYPVLEHDSLNEIKQMQIPKNNADSVALLKGMQERKSDK